MAKGEIDNVTIGKTKIIGGIGKNGRSKIKQ